MPRHTDRRPDGRERQQKGKGGKRRHGWHKRAQVVELPDVGSGADPTSGEPRAIHRRDRTGNDTLRGDAL